MLVWTLFFDKFVPEPQYPTFRSIKKLAHTASSLMAPWAPLLFFFLPSTNSKFHLFLQTHLWHHTMIHAKPFFLLSFSILSSLSLSNSKGVFFGLPKSANTKGREHPNQTLQSALPCNITHLSASFLSRISICSISFNLNQHLINFPLNQYAFPLVVFFLFSSLLLLTVTTNSPLC